MRQHRTQEELAARLTHRKAAVRRTRHRLILPLLVECVILLILHPGFFGAGWFCTAMTHVSEFFSDLLRFRGSEDLDTYRYYLHIVCTWVEELPFYPLLAVLAPWVLPGWAVLTIVQSIIINFRINNSHWLSGIGNHQAPMVSGLYEAEKKAAMERYHQLTALCDNPFQGDQGVRVQSRRDYVVRWDQNGEILLKDVISGTLRLILRNGQAYVDTAEDLIPLRKGVPAVFRRDNKGGEAIVQSAITWLGDD